MIRVLGCLLVGWLSVGIARGEGKLPVLDVWPDKAPGKSEATGEEKDTTREKDNKVGGKSVIRLTNVAKPTLTVYHAPKEKANGAAVIVCPGGAYRILAMDLEGTEVCEWLNTLGVTAILLKYRVPAARPHLAPFQDAQRAVSLVRGKSKEWGIDPKRIGILGFSAGGHLAARTALNSAKRSYDVIDKVDEVSCRPDFAVLVYPGYLANEKKDGLRDDIQVTKDAPPMFLAHTRDDPVPVQNSELLAEALKKAGVEAHLQVYEKGGHGYGLRKSKEPCSTWNERCEEWLKKQGLLAK